MIFKLAACDQPGFNQIPYFSPEDVLIDSIDLQSAEPGEVCHCLCMPLKISAESNKGPDLKKIQQDETNRKRECDRKNTKRKKKKKKKSPRVITRSACHGTITITLNLKWPFKGQ